MKQVDRRWRLLGAAGWFLAGMALWVGGTLGWQELQARSIPKAAAPAPSHNEELAAS